MNSKQHLFPIWLRTSVAAVVVTLVTAALARGAVFYTETFGGGVDGWVAGNGNMTETWSTFGDPSGSGSLQGNFAAQGRFGVPNTGIFEANSGSSAGNLTGNYWVNYPGFTGFKFEFYAANILPSTMTFHMSDGVNDFYSTISGNNLNQGILQSTGAWYTVTVPLGFNVYNNYWYGGTANQFSNMLSSVSVLDVEILRNGRGAQTYYIDNFQIVNDLLLVPEPTSGLFWFGWALVFGGLRSKLGRRQRSPYALPQRSPSQVAV